MENDYGVNHRPFLLQQSSRQVWVQATGRALYQAGYGSIQFFIPLIFVNQVGLSATAVGIGVGCGSLAGILGHFLGGYLADSQVYGRKQALLFSAGLSILGAIVLALTQTLPLMIIANLLMGLSAGCYWTAADAAVVDVVTAEQRHKAFAVLVLADSLGGGVGIFGGGRLLSLVNQTQMFFLIDSLILLMFLALIQLAVVDTRQNNLEPVDTVQGFAVALNDRRLRLFVLVNVLFTTYIALVSSTLPLYLTNVFAASVPSTMESGSSLGSVANLFTWCYVGLGAVLQLPLVQVLSLWLRGRVLMLSMLLWGAGFTLIWLTGMVTSIQMILAIASLSLLSIASTIYKPFAPVIVAELAPQHLRGVYLAVSYQCWSIGYFIGSTLGGWVMDQSPSIAHHLWIVTAMTTICGLVILHFLNLSPSNHSTLVTEDPASVT